ncbi:hypothetical protein GOODEAATRI_034037 [Goodea atripinnis]|uniref:Immunoglobulin V-set domain-containing protein n=1 Tax=Goodea atripinnis TaxID=208336 RepID=A0ABV0Q3B1_9TELE
MLFWYQQMSSSSPQLVTSGYSDTTGRLSLKHEKPTKKFHLQISSAAVTDSAVYYCALQPTVTGNTRTLYLQYSTTSTRGPHTLFHLWFVRIQLRIKKTSVLLHH